MTRGFKCPVQVQALWTDGMRPDEHEQQRKIIELICPLSLGPDAERGKSC